jgi:SAM-dependent methyltransferase
MTVWDDIYKNFRNGGEAWASLSEDIHPLFKQFLERSEFTLKHALDIGCGTGKYLKLLQAGGFGIDGIDSSPTAVEIAQRELGPGARITCADMFGYDIPENRYDLILSVSTIHHGTKEQVRQLVDKIHRSIAENGKIFITLPDLASSKKWNTFKEHQKLAEGTYAPLVGPEKGLPHSFYSQEEIKELFSSFKNLQMDLDERGRWIIQAIK